MWWRSRGIIYKVEIKTTKKIGENEEMLYFCCVYYRLRKIIQI